MTLEVYSIDFDGCIGNVEFLAQTHKDILSANRVFIDWLNTSSHRKIVLIGSNRQAPTDDLANSSIDERGSCYPATRMISEAINALFDPFLLGDIYNNVPEGTTFNQAMEYISPNNKDYIITKVDDAQAFYNWIHDESKLTLVYAQIHKMSLENPDEDIVFNFIDDREDLLDNLNAYFLQYPELLPKNVSLCLKCYRGAVDAHNTRIDPMIKEYPPIYGKSKRADKHYPRTVKEIAAVTIEQMIEKKIDISASKAQKAITCYAEAKKYHFALSAIKCIKYYQPGMTPAGKVDKTPGKSSKESFSFFRKKPERLSTSAKLKAEPSHNPAPIKTTVNRTPWLPSIKPSRTKRDSYASSSSEFTLGKSTLSSLDEEPMSITPSGSSPNQVQKLPTFHSDVLSYTYYEAKSEELTSEQANFPSPELEFLEIKRDPSQSSLDISSIEDYFTNDSDRDDEHDTRLRQKASGSERNETKTKEKYFFTTRPSPPQHSPAAPLSQHRTALSSISDTEEEQSCSSLGHLS